MRPKILCISFSDIQADARVLRQLDVLAEFGDVTTLGYGTKPDAAAEHLEIDSALWSLPQTPLGVALLALRRFKAVEFESPAIKAALKLLADREYDLIVANEARALPLAHRVARQAPVWGDMHEWAPEERVQVLSWRLLIKPFMTYVCKNYLSRTHAVTAVNDSIARLYDQEFGCQTVTVRNARPYVELEPSVAEPGVIRLVHSGAAVPGRNLEGMIEAVNMLGNGYSLDFYLIPARDGGRYLRALEAMPSDKSRIRFHPPVSPAELPAVLNGYDVGIYTLPPQTRNQELMLPNKFFDFVQARLAIVFGPSPETSTLIQDNELGVVTTDFSPAALADAIAKLTAEDVAAYKANVHAAARLLSSASDEEAERGILRKLL